MIFDVQGVLKRYAAEIPVSITQAVEANKNIVLKLRLQ